MTQPDGVGALHISSARKLEGAVLASEALSQLRENCPDGTETESARCGDFEGHAAEYVDWNEGLYWKKWFVACREILLFATYNRKRGEEGLESPHAQALLSSLRCRE